MTAQIPQRQPQPSACEAATPVRVEVPGNTSILLQKDTPMTEKTKLTDLIASAYLLEPHEQHQLAERVAANVGYELVPETEERRYTQAEMDAVLKAAFPRVPAGLSLLGEGE
jgi:hypothetical protein